MNICRLAALALLIAAASPLPALGQEWESRAEGSDLEFSAWYEGEEIPGRFTRFSVRLTTDAEAGEPASLTVEVDTGSADMNDGEINQELGEPDWFDTAAYPSARFVSDKIVPADEVYLAHGQLQIKDIVRSLAVAFTWRRDGDRRRLQGAVNLSRLAWEVGAGEWASDASLADPVQVKFDVELHAAN